MKNQIDFDSSALSIGQFVNLQLDGFFISFKSLLQFDEFFGQGQIALGNTLICNKLGCIFDGKIFWIFDINDFPIFTSNDRNTVFAHHSHFTSLTVTTDGKCTIYIVDIDFIKNITVTTISQYLIIHFTFPCNYRIFLDKDRSTLIIDHDEFRVYTNSATAKSVAGRCNPEISTAHNRASGFFVCVARLHLSMVGRAGQSKDWPGSVGTGIATPARLTTHERCNSGGEFTKLPTEVATMAATPTKTQPEFSYSSKTNLAHHALLTSALLDAICYLAASGDSCAQKHITDLCVIASERADQLAEEIEISEVRA